MWWSFRKSTRVGKGLRLNISRSGLGLSKRLGRRGSVSIGPRGRRWSFGLFGIRFGGKL